jgi:DNA polymerase-3 subunit delta'
VSWTKLIGHDAVLNRLRCAVRRGRLAHAYLFVGPDGIGKRRIAQHLAQGLLCESRPHEEIDPCRECVGCKQIEAGTHPDFMEVGKPTDRHELPIAVIQQLCLQLGLKPARGGYRIVVVDDADLLNEESANCFLKTLEEPPPKSLLILLATNPEMQLPTITSRCQSVTFSELAESQVAELLTQLGATADSQQARQIARLANGSIGQALALAQSDWIDARERILVALARPTISSVSLTDELLEYLDAAKDGAAKRARARQVIRLAAEFYRDGLRSRLDPAVAERSVDAERVRAIAGALDVEVLIDLVERCIAADFHIARFLNPTLSIDCWVDDLAQILAGGYVPPIGRLTARFHSPSPDSEVVRADEPMARRV